MNINMNIIQADGKTEYDYLKVLKERQRVTDKDVTEKVQAILDDVRAHGDEAVQRYTKQFDGVDTVKRLNREEIATAYEHADPALKATLKRAKTNIETFHRKQLPVGFEFKDHCSILGQTVRGLDKVGIYVPGGTAAYPSTVLMNAIPARIAGVKELIMITPPRAGDFSLDILTAAYIADVDTVYMLGGAHGVAALAYGTETIPRVDKIVGPGNIYVATAKRLLYGICDIDMVAGPSEILVMADDKANPVYVAADLMSQAEHDKLSSAILLTDSIRLATLVVEELNHQIQTLSRADIIVESLQNFGGIIVCQHVDKMIELANFIAPEHLEVMLERPMQYLGDLRNAGSIFLGQHSPEPLGDYFAGPNHVLPTSGTARFFSPLSVDSFVKKSQYIYYSDADLQRAAEDIIRIATHEGLTAHANSIQVRKK